MHLHSVSRTYLTTYLSLLMIGLIGTPHCAAEVVGQLEQDPQLFRGGTEADGRDYFLYGQPAVDGKLVLTASNGFFDAGVCRAEGQSTLPRADDQNLIAPNFECLDNWKKTDGGLRWHFWTDKPGAVQLQVWLQVSEKQAGSEIRVSLGGDVQTVRTSGADATSPQPWNLKFDLQQPGEQTLELTATSIASAQLGVGKLQGIVLAGSAIESAQLLRARWRPAAVHGHYSSSVCPESRVWVMTTRSTTDTGSYSPITTPFGYYGTSFRADGRSEGGFNFSMWAASRKGSVPPLQEMPHLLAAGSPDAQFSGFGHEGSGVKLRGWTAMPDQPKTVIQSLRVENDGDYHTYYGYFWDHPTKRWKLYAVGRKWSNGKTLSNLKPGSFCEVPGPPHIQRTGDLPREVVRRGWALEEEGKWRPLDQFHCSKGKGAPMNKSWSLTAAGEFAMTTGGMRYYEPVKTIQLTNPTEIPPYLSPAATKQLYQLPATFAEPETVEAGAADATVNLRLEDAGTNAKLIVYYGETDCLTFAPRRLHATERRSEVSQAGQSDDRTWSHATEAQSAGDGDNLVRLTGLEPGKTYFYRALVVNEEGQTWMFDSHSLSAK
ncbi:DUF3472 domain-containing protein [Blastopirellula retiformator]|uniref:DUF5077 domain-containing protein n=1 Tax=Blastopirellula retiformator TaxID=2527970 RepID=A0A5C5V380_9BACT|nr:DUF3472 domain-containing protein [Blastopirellula retiformator]TWT32998.1 hypothetical protein Enr8_28150 [Blastopirellula retiformator]